MAKPEHLIYGVDERPSVFSCLLSGIQHAFVMSSTLILPVVIISEVGGSQLAIQNMVSLTMVAVGLTTILQAFRGPVGCGYLCPYLTGVPYFAASVKATWAGGVSLLAGMLILAGLFESIFSRLVRRLQFLFPAEVTGVVVMMVGVALIPLGVSSFMGIETSEALYVVSDLVVGAITLSAMIGLTIWGGGKLRVYCVFTGMLIGYAAAYGAGVLTPMDLGRMAEAELVTIPSILHGGWTFDASLVFPFLIAALCTGLKAIGDIITCQKINDDEWKKPNMHSISNGLLAGGIGTTLAGILGGMGISTSSSNIGVSVATGTTSRIIGFFAGGLFIVSACLPKVTTLFSVMPAPVMGAILVFVTCYMVTAGMQILLTVEMDARKVFVIGLAIVFGLSADILPDLYNYIPTWVKPVFSSSLTLSTVVAILLTQVFRAGDAIFTRS